MREWAMRVKEGFNRQYSQGWINRRIMEVLCVWHLTENEADQRREGRHIQYSADCAICLILWLYRPPPTNGQYILSPRCSSKSRQINPQSESFDSINGHFWETYDWPNVPRLQQHRRGKGHSWLMRMYANGSIKSSRWGMNNLIRLLGEYGAMSDLILSVQMKMKSNSAQTYSLSYHIFFVKG